MRLQALIGSNITQPDFSTFIRKELPRDMPPLELKKLILEGVVGNARKNLKTPIEGDASLVLKYKGKEAAVSSLAEQEDGEQWAVLQLQGAKTNVAYRVASCLNWTPLFAREIRNHALHPASKVRRLVMPPSSNIQNIEDAVSRRVHSRYEALADILGMQYSEEENLYAADIRR